MPSYINPVLPTGERFRWPRMIRAKRIFDPAAAFGYRVKICSSVGDPQWSDNKRISLHPTWNSGVFFNQIRCLKWHLFCYLA